MYSDLPMPVHYGMLSSTGTQLEVQQLLRPGALYHLICPAEVSLSNNEFETFQIKQCHFDLPLRLAFGI